MCSNSWSRTPGTPNPVLYLLTAVSSSSMDRPLLVLRANMFANSPNQHKYRWFSQAYFVMSNPFMFPQASTRMCQFRAEERERERERERESKYCTLCLGACAPPCAGGGGGGGGLTL